MTECTVASADFRAALAAVVPHAGIPKDPFTHRVRLDIGRVNVGVSATNRVTAAHAIVSVEAGDDEVTPAQIDITPADAKAVISLFQGGAGGDEEQPGDLLALRFDGSELSITDAGGLFDGKSLVLPSFGTPADFPAIQRMLKQFLTRKRTASDIGVDAKMLGLFAAAGRAYSSALAIETNGEHGAVLVSCGESFLGAVMPVKFEEDAKANLKEWREAWLRRFDDLPVTGLQDAIDKIAQHADSISFTPAGGETTTVDLTKRRRRDKVDA